MKFLDLPIPTREGQHEKMPYGRMVSCHLLKFVSLLRGRPDILMNLPQLIVQIFGDLLSVENFQSEVDLEIRIEP